MLPFFTHFFMLPDRVKAFAMIPFKNGVSMSLCIRGPGLISDHVDERHQIWNRIKVRERQPGHYKLSTGDGSSSVPAHYKAQELGQCHLQDHLSYSGG